MSTAVPIRIAFAVALVVGSIAGCVQPLATLPSTSPSAASDAFSSGSPQAILSTNGAQPSVVAVTGGSASARPSSGVPATPSATATPTAAAPTAQPTNAPASGLLTMTRAEAGSTISVARGERVLVRLGTDFDWTVTVSDPRVLARVPGVTLVSGAQGLYVAEAAGQATISAVGDLPCRKSHPACMTPSLLISVIIAVR
jgi:hypothetical protein